MRENSIQYSFASLVAIGNATICPSKIIDSSCRSRCWHTRELASRCVCVDGGGEIGGSPTNLYKSAQTNLAQKCVGDYFRIPRTLATHLVIWIARRNARFEPSCMLTEHRKEFISLQHLVIFVNENQLHSTTQSSQINSGSDQTVKEEWMDIIILLLWRV